MSLIGLSLSKVGWQASMLWVTCTYKITPAHILCAFVNDGPRSLLYQLARAKKAASWIDSKFHSVLARFNGRYKKETHVALMKFRFSSSLRLCNWRSPFFNYKTDANLECKKSRIGCSTDTGKKREMLWQMWHLFCDLKRFHRCGS